MAQLSKSILETVYARYKDKVPVSNEVDSHAKKVSLTRLKFSVNSSIETPQDALEKIRNGNTLTSISSLLRGFEAGQSVGLIFNSQKDFDNSAEGTGFMIAPNILITNNHVINSIEQAKSFRLRMNYQRDLDGQIDPFFEFDFLPEKYFVTDEHLDFTIISVKPRDITGKINLDEFGYLKMFEASGKITKDEFAAIIQHPDGKPKQTSFFKNKVEYVDDKEFITYSTDTSNGSSGSPVFNYDWVVFALHHSGIPSSIDEVRGNSANEIDESSFSREANEGIRVSAIMKKMKELHPVCYGIINAAANAPIVESLPKEPFKYSRDFIKHQEKNSNLESINKPSVSDNQPQINLSTMSQNTNIIRFNIPLEIRIGDIGGQVSTETSNVSVDDLEKNKKKAPKSTTSQASMPQNREGYNATFLGNELEIQLSDIYKPFLTKKLIAPNFEGKNELHYTHFSVVMHKARRMAVITAVNIDGNLEVKIPRGSDNWLLDGRMEARFQLDNRMYSNNDLDRGHMVRREDPNWGDEASLANEDTFFYTNACPQHKDLNQKEWLSLEDYVLKNVKVNDLKVSVFTGPVLDENFVPYREGLVPAQFYKIVAMIKKDGKPSVTGYVLSQKELISELEKIQSDFEFSKFKTYQVSLTKIEEMTGLDLSKLKTFDPLKREQEGVLNEITAATDLVL